MKKSIGYIVGQVAIAIVAYLLIAACELSLNAFDWQVYTRLLFVLILFAKFAHFTRNNQS